MAEIKPFRGLRFSEKAGTPDGLCCPPYDIISDRERQEYLAVNPHNVVRLELPREGADPYPGACRTLREWQESGILKRDTVPSFYIYEESFIANGKPYAVKGFICRVKLEEFSKGVVLPHEETLSKAKADRFELMRATGCNFSQIYSLYMDRDGSAKKVVDRWSSGAPEEEFTDCEGVTHRLWIAEENDETPAFCALFADRKLYIADGHHRYETALNYRNRLYETGKAAPGGDADYVMMMLTDMENPGLVVFPTHRVVRDLPGFDTEAMLTACDPYFDRRTLELRDLPAALREAYDSGKKAFGFYDGDSCRLLVLKDAGVMSEFLPDKSPALRGLDVSVLHTLILERILKIDAKNMADQVNLSYTRDEDEAVRLVSEGDANCCFILNPTRVSEIAGVAAAGEKMPQKSTYFYPKLITGLVMNQILESPEAE